MAWQKGKARSSGNGSHATHAVEGNGKRRPQAEQRHRLPLPDSAILERAFVYDSASKTLIAPWSRTHSTFATQDMLMAMLRVLTENGTPHGVYWVHPDRPPTRVEAADVHRWLAHWSRDHAAYAVADTIPAGRGHDSAA